jgi:hypothetical protein
MVEAAVKVIKLAGAEIECHPGGYTITRLPEGDIPAWPEDSEAYRQRARDLGYGDDVFKMFRDHELGHAIYAWLKGMPCSPVMLGLATGKHSATWREEEGAVLELQRWSRSFGVDLEVVAQRMAEQTP